MRNSLLTRRGMMLGLAAASWATVVAGCSGPTEDPKEFEVLDTSRAETSEDAKPGVAGYDDGTGNITPKKK